MNFKQKKQKLVKKLILNSLIILNSALWIGIFAQISIQIPNQLIIAPITGQTLAILVVSYLLHKVNAILSVLLYLILGVAGLPVFAAASSGWEVFINSTLGYFIGFVIACIYVACCKSDDQNFLSILFHFCVASALILLCGFLGLLRYTEWSEAYAMGVEPFIIGGVLKAILATSFVYVLGILTYQFKSR